MAETALKKRLNAWLTKRGIPFYSAGAGPYATSGIADKIGCLPPSGRLLWIEAKDPARVSMRVRAVQKRKAAEYEKAGALVIISNDFALITRTIEEALQ